MRSNRPVVCFLLLTLLSADVISPSGAEEQSPPDKPQNVLQRAGIQTGFEQLPVGAMTHLVDASGTWEAQAGHATIHAEHARSGKQSLRLLGGQGHQVVWTPPPTDSPTDRLEFWMERWTRREPFDFRVEAFSQGKWQTLHHDTRQAVVGSFKNHLILQLKSGMPAKFRFSSTTPPDSGVMIDDLRLFTATPMRVVSLVARQPVVPALIGNQFNPTLILQCEVDGSLEPLTLTALEIEAHGSATKAEIEQLEVRWLGPSAAQAWQNIAALSQHSTQFGGPQALAKTMHFRGKQQLQSGINQFVVAVKVKRGADQARRLDLRCTSVRIGGAAIVPQQATPYRQQRIGVALRKPGDQGVHTYRIPGLATTTQGSLIGVYDVRRRSGGDLPGDIDVGMSRSTDGGRTWEAMQVIMDMGNDPKWRYDGIGDPAILVDRNTGTIWVAATWSHGNRSWRGSGPGLKPAETGQLMLVRSDDDGLTWSPPINITEQVKQPEWCFILQGPGKGITMQDGTLVFAAQYQDPPERNRLPHSTIIYSTDHGKSWHVGRGAFDDTTESQVVEVEPGVLMLNCRYNRESTRVVMTTRDLGKTWHPHPSSRGSLIEPRACMASLIDVDQEVGQDCGGWLLFSNPDSIRAREQITIKASRDGGRTWPQQHRLLLDEARSAGYSCLTMIDAETIGILYEGSMAHMTFQRIPLRDVVGPQPERVIPADEARSHLSPTFE